MADNTPLSERVRTVSQERVDRIDFDLLQEMVDQGIRRQLGGIMGYGQGVVSPYLTTYNNVTFTLTFGRFSYCSVEDIPSMRDAGTDNSKGWRGGFYIFDPNSPVQAAEWSIAAARAAAAAGNAALAYPFILARPEQVNSATESRIQWSAGAETPVAIQTRKTIRHQIQFSNSLPATTASDGWTVVGKITAWSSFGTVLNPGSPTVTPVSVFDNPRLNDANNFSDLLWWGSANPIGMQPVLNMAANGAVSPDLNMSPTVTGPADVGLLKLLSVMRAQLARILESQGGVSWWTNPGYVGGGLSQIWAKLTPLWTDYDQVTAVRPWASAYFSYSAGPNVYQAMPASPTNGSPRKIISVTRLTTGEVSIVLDTDGIPTSWRYSQPIVTIATATDSAYMTPRAYLTGPIAPNGMGLRVHLRVTPTVNVDVNFHLTVFITKDV